jgi:ribonuclease E
LRPSLGESSQIVCPRCAGQGSIRSVESLSLSILRLMEEEAMKDKTGKIIVQVPVEVATYLLNEKRQAVLEIEDRQQINIVLIPNRHIYTPSYELQRVRQDERKEVTEKISYKLVTKPQETVVNSYSTPPKPELKEEPAVKGMIRNTPPPLIVKKEVASEPGFFKRLWGRLFQKKPEQPVRTTSPPRRRGKPPSNKSNQRRRSNPKPRPPVATTNQDQDKTTTETPSSKKDNRSATFVRRSRRRKRPDSENNDLS